MKQSILILDIGTDDELQGFVEQKNYNWGHKREP